MKKTSSNGRVQEWQEVDARRTGSALEFSRNAGAWESLVLARDFSPVLPPFLPRDFTNNGHYLDVEFNATDKGQDRVINLHQRVITAHSPQKRSAERVKVFYSPTRILPIIEINVSFNTRGSILLPIIARASISPIITLNPWKVEVSFIFLVVCYKGTIKRTVKKATMNDHWC